MTEDQEREREREFERFYLAMMRDKKKGRDYGTNAWYARDQYRRKRLEATRRGLPFDLTAAHIEELLDDATYCPALDIYLMRSEGQGGSDDTPSLDRVEPELGYVIGNVRVISWRANKLKGDATLDEFRGILNYWEDHIRNRK